MQRVTNYSMDLEAVGLGEPTADLKFDMYCPEAGCRSSNTNNWSSEQCTLRVRVNNPCVVKCAYGRKLKAEMDSTGKPYVLEPFLGVVVGEKTKRKEKREPNPNDRWPGRNKERDMKMAIALINGAAFVDLSKQYKICTTAIRKSAYRYFHVANPRVFAACPDGMSKAVFAQVNKDLILPFLVFHKEEGASLKGA